MESLQFYDIGSFELDYQDIIDDIIDGAECIVMNYQDELVDIVKQFRFLVGYPTYVNIRLHELYPFPQFVLDRFDDSD